MEKVTTVEGIAEYSMANGLHVLLFPDPSRPIITVNITYKVGSRQEDYGEKGMAHLLEHLMFKGTPRHNNIPQELSEHGSRANGTTDFDRTNYYETFDATEENLRWALDLESDRMVNSFIAKRDLDSEFSVVRNEFEMGENNPTEVLDKRMEATVFQWHNYGRDTIGEKSDIEGAPIERLQAYYRKYYQPDNAVLVIAGKLDEQKTLDLVQEYFGKIQRPPRTLVPTYTKEPTQDGERQITLRRVGDLQVVDCMYRLPAGTHPDSAPLAVLVSLLTDEPSGRLYQALVEGKKAARVYGRASSMAEAGVATFVAEVRLDQSLEQAKQTMLATLDALKEQPANAEEVARAKNRLLKNFELMLKQSDRLGLQLSDFIGMGDWRLAFVHRDGVEAVKPADVARVAQQYFKTSNRCVGLFIPDAHPDRAEIPDGPDIAKTLKGYVGKASLAQGEDFDVSPANIEKRTTRGQLANGMRYALLSKQTRGDAVRASLTFRFGTLETLRGQSMVGRLTASMLDKGTEQKTRQQIRDLLDELKARVQVVGGESQATVSIETDREHLGRVLQLTREMLRQPALPAHEFETLKQERLASLEESKTEPQALASTRMARLSKPEFAKDDPRYVMNLDEEIAAIKEISLEQLKDFHHKFYGASHATVAVVGRFDAKAIETVLRECFGDWENPSPYQRIAEDYQTVSARTEVIPTPDKANAVYLAGYGFAMRDDDAEYPPVLVSGYLIGGGFLNSRLATRIRQKEGLSYGVGGGFTASPLDKDTNFRAFMIYNPKNLAKLETAFREEIERAAKDGFTEAELESGKVGLLKSFKVSRSNDAGLAAMLNRYLHYGRDLTRDAKLETDVQNLTLAQVNEATRKYLDYARMIVVKAGDFKTQP
jgi:zinc protease